MALLYAGIGSRQTPDATLRDMTLMAQWLSRTGWHLASGGALGADTAFARGAPAGQRTLYLPWADYNRLAGPDCVIPEPSDMEACIALAARLHPAWDKCSQATRRMHGRNAAILLGPRLDTPVAAVVAWTPGGTIEGGTGMGLRIAAEHGIEVLNLATMKPRAACERLLDIGRGLSPAARPLERLPAAPRASRTPAAPTATDASPQTADPATGAPDPARTSRLAPPHGPAPDPDATRSDEHEYRADARDIWDPYDAVAAVRTAYAALHDLCPDDSPLGRERQALSHGFVHAFRSEATRLFDGAERARRDLDRARGVDRGVHDPHAARIEELESVQFDDRRRADYAHSERGRRDKAGRVHRTPLPGKSKRARAAVNADPRSRDPHPDDIPDLVTGYNNIAWRAESLDEIATIAAECYQADFGEVWLPPGSRKSFDYNASLDPSYIRKQRDNAETRPRLASWLTRWQILHQQALNRKVPVAEMPAYTNMVSQAHDLRHRDGLPDRDMKWLSAFLQKHPLQAPSPDSPDPSHERTNRASSSAWDRGRAFAVLHTLVDTLDKRILVDGTQLAEQREHVLSALAHWLHRERNRIAARIEFMEARNYRIPQGLRTSLAAFADLRNGMATTYRHRTGKNWTAPADYASDRTKSITASGLAADMAVNRHSHASATAQNVAGTYIVVSGSRDWTDAGAVHQTLDAMKERYPDMVLIHGGGAGAAEIARSWASARGVDQILYKPQWNKHGKRAAPIRRNEEILKQKPHAIVSFNGPGDPEHIAMEGKRRGIPVTVVQDPALTPQLRQDGAPAPAASPLDIDPLPAPTASPDHLPAPSPPLIPPPDAPDPAAARAHPGPASDPGPVAPIGYESRRDDGRAAPEPLPASAGASLSPDEIQGLAFADRLGAQLAARPAVDHPMVDGRLLHYLETPAFKAWANRTQQLLDHAFVVTENLDPPPDAAKPDVIDCIDARVTELQHALYANGTFPSAIHLFEDVQSRLEAIRLSAKEQGYSWIDHPDTPDLMRRADALAEHDDARHPDTAHIQDPLREIHLKYDVAVELRQDLDNIADDISAHLEAREALREDADHKNLHLTEHPDYDDWNVEVDNLEDQASCILENPEDYGDHLKARPALATSIRCNIQILVSARDADINLARALPPPSSKEPDPTPVLAETPALARARRPEPDPEPAPGPSIGL